MNKWLKIGTFAAVVALIALTSLGAGSAFAQGPVTGNPMYGNALGLGGSIGGPQNSLVAIAAKLFGMDQTALVAELNTGKTLADVAQAKNVSLDALVNAALQTHTQTLQAAVAAQRLTQAQADAMLATSKTQITTELTTPFAARGNGAGLGFVDANHDGVCDTCGSATPMNRPFAGRGRGNR